METQQQISNFTCLTHPGGNLQYVCAERNCANFLQIACLQCCHTQHREVLHTTQSFRNLAELVLELKALSNLDDQNLQRQSFEFSLKTKLLEEAGKLQQLAEAAATLSKQLILQVDIFVKRQSDHFTAKERECKMIKNIFEQVQNTQNLKVLKNALSKLQGLILFDKDRQYQAFLDNFCAQETYESESLPFGKFQKLNEKMHNVLQKAKLQIEHYLLADSTSEKINQDSTTLLSESHASEKQPENIAQPTDTGRTSNAPRLSQKKSMQKAPQPIQQLPQYTSQFVEQMLLKLPPYELNNNNSSNNENKQALKTLGPMQFEDGSVYIGQWLDTRRHGIGKQLWKDGSIYEGYWQNGFKHGRGRLIDHDGQVYEGEWKKDKAHGIGSQIDQDEARYQGNWRKDKKNGYGVEEWRDGSKYQGNYRDGMKNGLGKFSWANGSTYEGSFLNDEIDGHGTYTWIDGRKYVGDWKDSNMHGYGEHTWSDGRKYRGHYLNDLKEGEGEFEWPDGTKYVGQWHQGTQHGIGLYTNTKGIQRRGEWQEGKRINWLS